jgi:hypothetical protein
MTAPPAPLFAQQQLLKTLVDEWDTMSADEEERMLAGHLRQRDCQRRRSGPAGSFCEDWRPYIVAAKPEPVTDLRAPTERKTGLEPAIRPAHATRPRWGLDLMRLAA